MLPQKAFEDQIKSKLAESKCFSAAKSRAFVTLTYAQSINGTIATSGKEPLAISCHESMTLTHKLRSWHDTILVGVGTVIADNPSLTVRFGIEGTSPLPIIIDSHLRTPPNCKLMQRSADLPLIFCAEEDVPSEERQKREVVLLNLGAKIVPCPLLKSSNSSQPTGCNLNFVFSYIWSTLGLSSVMVEGGSAIISSLLHSMGGSENASVCSSPECESILADQLMITISPMFALGTAALSSASFKTAKLIDCHYSVYGSDAVLLGYPPTKN